MAEPTPTSTSLSPTSLVWAVPALLRALRVGHRSHRAGFLRLLAAQDDATLQAEPARSALEAFLRGDDPELARAAGALISTRGLAAYAPALLDLLRRPDRALEAERWLRRGAFQRPTQALIRLAADPKAELAARAAALRLLEGAALSGTERALLVTTLAHGALHGPALRVLEPGATEDLVVAAVAANMAYGRALARRRREERTGSPEPSWFQGLLSRLTPDHDALGVHRSFKAEQQDFVRGIARLAIAARSDRWLLNLLDQLFDGEVGAALEQAYVEQQVERAAGPLLTWFQRPFSPGESWTERRRARALRVLGELARAEALPAVARCLPQVGSPADGAGRAAIVAMARLLARTGQPLPSRSQLDLLLAGAAAFVRRALGQPPGDAPGDRSTVAACLEAGAALGDARVAQVALDLLGSTVDVPEVGTALAPALATLAPLELEPALERVLTAPDARPRARAAAVEVVERLKLARLAPQVVRAAALERSVADRAARALTALVGALAPDDVRRHVEDLSRVAGPGDATLDALLEAAARALPPDAARGLARAVLVGTGHGGGGRRTRRRALELARQDPDPRALLDLTLALLDSPHGDARTVALELALAQGLVGGAQATSVAVQPGAPADTTTSAGAQPAAPAGAATSVGAQPAAPAGLARNAGAQPAAPAPALAPSALEPAWSRLPRLLAQALERHDAEGWARKQVALVLDALLPRGGRPGLSRDEADDLRARLRQAGAWVQPATFHAAQRTLLELQARGVEVGLLHGGVLALLAGRRVQHPKTGKQGPYEGPLPRLDEARAHASPFVQEALWDLVATASYRRTLRLVLSFLASPRPRVRAAALGLVPRDGALAHDDEVLARLDDPAPEVREAAVQLLARHELARYAQALAPRLHDPVERVRLAAARTLARWGDRGGLELVATFLDARDEALRREAVEHLRRFEPAQLVGLLAPYVTLTRPRAAAAALAALRPDRGLPDDDALRSAVFQVAAQGAGPLRAAALALLPQVTDAPRLAQVVPLLGDADPHVRAAAAHVLRRLDGRPHAAAVAQLAAGSPAPQVRRELLALLVDLDVPEATRGLLPLLLDHDPRVRGAAHALAGRLRGPSLLPELQALLARGLDLAAPPEALRELVRLLDRTGGDDAAPALVDALRCEERGVWEAVLEAARTRGSDAHGGRLAELLRASRPLPPPLLTLALGEVARLGRRDLRDVLERLAREDAAETVRRKALDALAALDAEAGVAAALAEAKAAQARLAELERRPEAKDRKRTKALRLERARLAGSVTGAALVALRAARDRRALEAALRALPDEALRRTDPRVPLRHTVAGVALDRAAEVVAREGEYPSDAAIERLGLSDAWERVGWRLRDRLATAAWLERGKDLVKGKASPALDPARLLARARAGQPLDAAELLQRAKEPPTPAQAERSEDLALGVAATWRPELVAGVFGPLLDGAIARVTKLPPDRWGGKARAVVGAVERWGQKKLALDLREGTAALVTLGPELPQTPQGDVLARLLAAEGDVARLVAELERRTEADRLRLVALLGEVGGREALDALGRLGGPDAPVKLREACARATAHTGPSAEPLVARWLQDGDPTVLSAALRAVDRLGLGGQADAVVRLLGHSSPAVQKAAADAAGALRLARARDGLLALLRGPTAPPPTTGGDATLVLEHPGAQPIHVIKTLRELLGLGLAEARDLLQPGAVLQTGLAAQDAEARRRRLEEVGARAVVRAGGQAAPGVGAGPVDAVREAAARALERLPQAELVGADPTPLVEALRGRVKADRAVESLARVLSRVVGSERLDAVVGPLLGEPGEGAVVGALRVLARREHRAAAPAVRSLLVESKSGVVRAAAADAAGELGDADAQAALRDTLARDLNVGARGAALRALHALLRRAGDAEGAARLALEHLGHPDLEVARAAAQALAEHPAPGRLHDDAARGLLAALRDHVAPGAPLPEVDEPPAAFAARCAGALRAGPQRARLEALVAALAAQGDVARTEQAGHLLLLLTTKNVDGGVVLALRPCLRAAPGAPWREGLLQAVRSKTTDEAAAANALRLLAEVDVEAAANEALARLQAPGRRQGREDLLRVLVRARRAAAGGMTGEALAAWLRRTLLAERDEERRLARAGLEPGRFEDLLGEGEVEA